MKNGFPVTSIREILALKKLKQHDNIVRLVDIARSQNQFIYLVFEFCEHDLQQLVKNPAITFSKPQLKYILQQILKGLHAMHEQNLMHRDIKGGNILINNKGQVKLADFGLARLMKPGQMQYTTKVVTRWFRAPELALEDPCYDERVDVWSVGCTFAEMIA